MSKLSSRTAAFGLLLVGLSVFPAGAQTSIPAGKDAWVTPGNGLTSATLGPGDLEALCSAAPSSGWNHVIAFQGVPFAGVDYDTVVARLNDAVFDGNGLATTRVQVIALAFRSIAPTSTPCGTLNFTVGLSSVQPVTTMTIVRTSISDTTVSPVVVGGGTFRADLVVNVLINAYLASTGGYIGTIPYSINLPQPTGAGTPWSWAGGVFRPGITTTDDCIAVLRRKLTTYPNTSDHYYYISNMIAQGRCTER